MSVRIHLVTVAGGYAGALPHMLAHYRACGVESIFVNVHAPAHGDPSVAEIEGIARRAGCEAATLTVGEWQLVQRELYERQRRQYPSDWFVLADQDELQEWPGGLQATIEECDARGYDYVRGCFVDRIARDGGFPKLREDVPIEEQFPLGAFLSNPVLGADPRKVVAVKGALPLQKGQHHALAGKPCPARDHYIPIHHYKWVEGLSQRLEARAEALRVLGAGHWVESANFVRYYQLTKGRITLEDPHLLVGECAPAYPHWEKVKQVVLRFPQTGRQRL